MKRVYHHYEHLEEWHVGMWRIVRGPERKHLIERAANLMRQPHKFEAQMIRAIKEWTHSCEHNFTAESINKIAWLGHAGCCLGANSPEEATRAAWHTLSKKEQDLANEAAERALMTWTPQIASAQLELF